jgi:hypothetical protein
MAKAGTMPDNKATGGSNGDAIATFPRSAAALRAPEGYMSLFKTLQEYLLRVEYLLWGVLDQGWAGAHSYVLVGGWSSVPDLVPLFLDVAPNKLKTLVDLLPGTSHLPAHSVATPPVVFPSTTCAASTL